MLVRSEDLKRRYKHDPVIVSFEWGKGVVYHMISHFYLQRTETRTKKQGQSGIYLITMDDPWLNWVHWLEWEHNSDIHQFLCCCSAVQMVWLPNQTHVYRWLLFCGYIENL